MSDVDLAYCAGLFDGEGCVSVAPYVTSDERERYPCELTIGMQNLEAIEFFQRVVGTGNTFRRGDGLWVFRAAGAKGAQVAKALLPFLRVKREVARLFVEFASTFSSRNRKPIPADIMARRRALSQDIRRLMRVDVEDALAFERRSL